MEERRRTSRVAGLGVQVPHKLVAQALVHQEFGEAVLPDHVLVVVVRVVLSAWGLGMGG